MSCLPQRPKLPPRESNLRRRIPARIQAWDQKGWLRYPHQHRQSQSEDDGFLRRRSEISWPVSTAKAGYSTPSGTYTATSMNEIWYSKQWDNAPMPHSIFFMKDGHAIHGSYEVKNLEAPPRTAVCASHLRMPASFMHW